MKCIITSSLAPLNNNNVMYKSSAQGTNVFRKRIFLYDKER